MKLKLSLSLLLVTVLILVLASVALAGGRPLSTHLTGAAEIPGPGDPDGHGMAHITLNQGQGEICFEISVSNIATPTASHIHAAPIDQSGGVVVNFNIASNGLRGCVDGISEDLIKNIRQHPENYYINVHNADFPPGALRGQLGK